MSIDKPYCNPEIWGGIECTINRVNNNFFDQLLYTKHYDRIADIDAISDLNIKKIRYPILWEKHQPRIDSIIDWSWTENRLKKLNANNIDIIAGLIHHGSGPAYTNLLDDKFPELLADYAKKVAQKFPFIQYYTPVNEPLTTARFSGLYGLWYPHKKNNSHFLKMLFNELKGTVLAMKAIREVNPEAKLIQTEDLGKIYSTPKLKYQADYENERRWLSYDILCGLVNKEHKLYTYLINSGILEKELQFFLENDCTPDLFGFNYYITSERFLDEDFEKYPPHTHGGNSIDNYADVEAVRVQLKEETGIEVLLKEAWNRFKKPMVITEVHLHCTREEQLRWFKYIWQSVNKLKSENIDIRAITSWALLGSFGWNKLLTEEQGEYEPGAFDLRGGIPRPTALAEFIKNINKVNDIIHPLSIEKGWWQRNTRFIYNNQNIKKHLHKVTDVPPILIIGKNGTLGKAFAHICEQRCIPFRLLDRIECNISDVNNIKTAIKNYNPWAVINAAGYVKVDEAEKNFIACYRDNTKGAKNVALACQAAGIQLVTFSSDLVFDGEKKTPYVESDAANPLNVYGRSKAYAENLVSTILPSSLIIRTSAFFGPWDEYNFVFYIHNSLQHGKKVFVSNDNWISPTYVPDLVHNSLDLLIDKEKGIWHMANKGGLTWSQLAFLIAENMDLDKSLIHAIPSKRLGNLARRPHYSVLNSEKGHLLPSIENALERYFNEIKTEREVA